MCRDKKYLKLLTKYGQDEHNEAQCSHSNIEIQESGEYEVGPFFSFPRAGIGRIGCVPAYCKLEIQVTVHYEWGQSQTKQNA